MTNYAIPTHKGPEAITFRQAQRIEMSESPFTYFQQILDHGGQRWEVDVRLPPMDHADARIWIAFLSKLKGPFHTFTMGDPLGAAAQGEAGGTPLVNGASQTGAALIIDGCSLTQTDWLKAGDYIQLDTGEDARLHMILDDVDTDGSGNATLNLWPEITTAPATNSAVVVADTVAAWRLASPVLPWDVARAAIYGIEFSAMSAVS